MINYLKNMKIKYPTASQEKRSSVDSEAGACKWKNCSGKKSFPYSNCILIAIPVLSFLALGIYFILVDLKILASVLNSNSSSNGTTSIADSDVWVLVEEEVNRTEWPATTAKAFVYSPTVPQMTDGEGEEDEEEESSDGANCFSTRLALCEGILPYDLVQLPDGLNATSPSDVDALLPSFERMIDAECSSRVRDMMCALLEPECRPAGDGRQVFPCRNNCQVLADECSDVIATDAVLSEIFDCRGNRSWGATSDCLDLYWGRCHSGEFQCPGGECIPQRSVCDGVIDCHDSSADEQNCPRCPLGSFRCGADSTCLPMIFVCDGVAQCSDNSDESSC